MRFELKTLQPRTKRSRAEIDAHAHAVRSDPRWPRVVARDRSADGQFWYGVATTGVYCRPSCPSRGANPKNVTFFGTTASARAAGFRACLRCRPDDTSTDAERIARVTTACRLLEDSDHAPGLADLAAAVELSPHYFHRLFKKVTGVTPKAYAAACRDARLREGLKSERSITHAIYGAGFSSSSRFYERSTDVLGMAPSKFRAGGADEVLTFAVAQCSLGAILVASSKRGVAAILLGDDPGELVRDLQDQFPRAQLVGGDREYERLVAKVIGFVEAPRDGLELPLDVRGTAFQQRVWKALRKVPAGTTMSYARLAARIGAPKAVRAVAGAVAANKLAVAIPCHRVIRNDGDVSGYRWGVERKRALLEREAEPA
jgi:AraC family transcriptional regulator of adaptative response/methylated-DNA-[protein]-cysteine methyltransferase